MKRCSFSLICFIVISILFHPVLVQAQEEEAAFEEILVTGEPIVTPTKQTADTVYTGEEVTKAGIEIEGSKAKASVYNAVDALPGISVESVDPFGLAAEQRNVRVRGIRGTLGAMTVEGVPNWGGNPMGPREYIYDTENFQGIAVYKGAIPADLGTGVGDRGGAMELRPQWPRKNFCADLSMSSGMHEYYRSFFRLDSGNLPTTGTRVSLSYSFTDAEKWKGPGDLGPRNNGNFMLQQPVWGSDDLKIWVNVNDVEQDLYRALTYAETLDLEKNRDKDFNAELTGRRIEDINYYKYNRADLTNVDAMSIIPITLNENFQLNFKPYFSKENSTILGGTASQGGLVQERLRDIERYGLISEIGAVFSPMKVSVGYLLESNDMDINTKNYNPATSAYMGWGNYSENEGNGILHSPYLKLAGKLYGLDWQAGLKYFYYRDPASQGFVWNSTKGVLLRAPDLDRESREYDNFFPSVGLSYAFWEPLQIYASYGRTFIRPYSYQPLLTLYNANRPTFQAAGVTLEDMFEGYDMEISNNYELGARFRKDRFEIMPTLFYSTNSNLLTTVYDPRVKLSYSQNIGEATGYGFELEVNAFINDNITLFVNPTYCVLTYDDDITYQGATLDTDGKQVVDTPEWMVKAGAIFRYSGFEIVPMLRYIGERYGDAAHAESVGDYFLADLMVSYTTPKIPHVEALKLSVELQNIFNRDYISVINASDDSRAGSAGYYVGAPFTAVLKASMEF